MTDKMKLELPVWVSLLIYIILVAVLCGLFASLVSLFFSSQPITTVAQILAFQSTVLVAVLIASWAVLRWVDGLSFSFLKLSLYGRGKSIFNGFMVAAVMYIIGFGLSLCLGLVYVDSASFPLGNLISGFIFFVIVALAEEIMFRGYILGRLLHAGINKYVALLISSTLFALIHFFNPHISVLSMINILIAGFMLGIVYVNNHNLWFPISLHLFWNWIQGPILGYEVSGIDLFSSILQLSLPTNSVWNGGLFGFEGSLICTLLMVIYVISVIVYYRRKPEVV